MPPFMLNAAPGKFASRSRSSINSQKALTYGNNVTSHLYPDLIPFLLLALRTSQMFCFHKNLVKNVCFAYKNLPNKTERVRKQYCADSQIGLTASQCLFS